MTKTPTVGGITPPTLADLMAARTDYEDVQVESLGGMTLRLYALTGTARARLLSTMVELAGIDVADATNIPPEQVQRVFMFQIRVVGASLGYAEAEWEDVGGVLGEATITQLFDVASKLSGLGATAQDEAVQRLRPVRNAASGTD